MENIEKIKPSREKLAKYAYKSLIENLKNYNNHSNNSFEGHVWDSEKTYVDEDERLLKKATEGLKNNLIIRDFLKLINNNDNIRMKVDNPQLLQLSDKEVDGLWPEDKIRYVKYIEKFIKGLNPEDIKELKEETSVEVKLEEEKQEKK